ncbi:MAG: glutaminyl-peptide cyclotransferase [bacterium]|nr:glutaminyl-peptide cyclotransferase [bacterium]
MTLTVLGSLPHDPLAFTQGLVLRDGLFYESTGLYNRSSMRIVDPATGGVLLFRPLDGRFFGEGLELVGDRLIQLTWKEETALVWDAETLEPINAFSYEGEGWGLCAKQSSSPDPILVMSDGSSWLTFRDPDTFEIVGEVEVLMEGVPISNLNELECVGDLVYANVWMTDLIVVINPTTGQVVGRVDASSLRGLLPSTEGMDVLNGIAYDPETGSFYLTGKFWPTLFEVTITPRA